jgi:signal transduction histidine kinase
MLPGRETEEAGCDRSEDGPRRAAAGRHSRDAYRVLQEGLTNVRKHAGARRVDVVLRYGRDAIGVEVSDDGNVSGAGAGSGRGLAGIRERVALLGGEFVAGPRARGFALRVTLPLA